MQTKKMDGSEFGWMDENGVFYESKVAIAKDKVAEIKASPCKCIIENGTRGNKVIRCCYNIPYQPQKLGLMPRYSRLI